MMDQEIITILYEHYTGLFPRSCASCGRVFPTLRQYILDTRPTGDAMSYDAELSNWKTAKPLGGAAWANCPCGTTLGLTTDGIPLPEIHRLLEWIKAETERQGITQQELLASVRDVVRERALRDPAMDPDAP